MTYFGNSRLHRARCRIEIPDARVVVVRDHELGTNDLPPAWIRRSYSSVLIWPIITSYQFRMSFENTQANGSFKVMEDNVADGIVGRLLSFQVRAASLSSRNPNAFDSVQTPPAASRGRIPPAGW